MSFWSVWLKQCTRMIHHLQVPKKTLLWVRFWLFLSMITLHQEYNTFTYEFHLSLSFHLKLIQYTLQCKLFQAYSYAFVGISSSKCHQNVYTHVLATLQYAHMHCIVIVLQIFSCLSNIYMFSWIVRIDLCSAQRLLSPNLGVVSYKSCAPSWILNVLKSAHVVTSLFMFF